MIPCYRTSVGPIELVFSDVADLDGVVLPRFRVNKQYLRAFLYSSELQVRDCGIENVTEILAGEFFTLCGTQREQGIWWDPAEICRTRSIDDFEEASILLSSTTQHCIDSWAAICPNIILWLSGGLDSSVVASSLARSPARPHVQCVNRFSEHISEDERIYARLAAASANFPLKEFSWEESQRSFASRLMYAPRIPKPFVPMLMSLVDFEFRNEIASGYGSDTIWTGQGGDHLFMQLRTSVGAADYFDAGGSIQASFG